MKPTWYWSNKPENEKEIILKKMSIGWKNLELRPKKNRVKCKCLFCGKEFEIKASRVKNDRGKFCSKKCLSDYRKILIDKECLYCKKKFKVSKLRITDIRIYCSKECFAKGMSIKITGKKRSIESKKRMSEFWKGRSRPWLMGKSYWKGKKHSEKTRKELSKTKMKDKNPNWRGGITKESKLIRSRVETKLWREAVFARDNWICQKYKIKGGILDPHHIFNFAEFLELFMSNLCYNVSI